MKKLLFGTLCAVTLLCIGCSNVKEVHNYTLSARYV